MTSSSGCLSAMPRRSRVHIRKGNWITTGTPDFSAICFFNVADASGYNPGKYRTGLYAVSKSFLDADVFINVPKLKTHGWSGITAALKNVMGTTIRTTSHYLPEKVMTEYMKRSDYALYRESPLRDVPHYKVEYWNGTGFVDRKLIGYDNDVLWRSLADLNRVVRYVDKDGKLQGASQRKYVAIVDAILGTDRGVPSAPAPWKRMQSWQAMTRSRWMPLACDSWAGTTTRCGWSETWTS